MTEDTDSGWQGRSTLGGSSREGCKKLTGGTQVIGQPSITTELQGSEDTE